jgi:prephenate dehydrogenase
MRCSKTESSISSEYLWDRVTVIGCGLIGASFALALRQCRACAAIAGWDSAGQVLGEAVERGVIDEIDREFGAGGVSSSDLIYLAMPVAQIIEFLRESGARIRPDAVVTDAGSTKVEICQAAQEFLSNSSRFVGGHPIAGSQRSGLSGARADLFQDGPYVLISDGHRAEDEHLSAVRATVSLMGAKVESMPANVHDRAVAFISHVPQILSSVLVTTVLQQPDSVELVELAGPGYEDMSRLAGSPWSIWGDILATNPTPIAKALDAVIEKLRIVRDELLNPGQDSVGDLDASRALFEKCQRPQP